MRTRKRDQVLVKLSRTEIYLFICWIENNKSPHISKTKTDTHTELFSSLLLYWKDFSLSNRLYMCNKSTSTCIKMTWIKQLCIKTTVNRAPYMSFLLVSVFSITRLLTIYQLKNQPIFQLSFLINTSSLLNSFLLIKQQMSSISAVKLAQLHYNPFFNIHLLSY